VIARQASSAVADATSVAPVALIIWTFPDMGETLAGSG
jgi:hypothetical protein